MLRSIGKQSGESVESVLKKKNCELQRFKETGIFDAPFIHLRYLHFSFVCLTPT